MGVDVSRGDGKDSSTIVILDFENLEQVAEFKYKLPPDLLAEIVYKYGNLISSIYCSRYYGWYGCIYSNEIIRNGL